MAAVLYFSSLKESDFGQYTLVLYNNKGNTTLSVYLNASEPNTGEDTGPSIAGIAGGLGGGVVVILIAGVVIFLWRRHNYTNKAAEDDRDMEFQERERPENGLVDNAVYETSSPSPAESSSMDATGAMYTTVVKPKNKFSMAEDPTSSYAQVEKAKRRKYKGGKKHENSYLPRKSPNQVDVYENSIEVANYLYEHSGATSANVTQVNKDCLLYADLNLDPPTLKNDKYVIHGLENRTEYAEIAYGKRGDPLPGSNDKMETNSGTR